jgi:hypothetical protein
MLKRGSRVGSDFRIGRDCRQAGRALRAAFYVGYILEVGGGSLEVRALHERDRKPRARTTRVAPAFRAP